MTVMTTLCLITDIHPETNFHKNELHILTISIFLNLHVQFNLKILLVCSIPQSKE